MLYCSYFASPVTVAFSDIPVMCCSTDCQLEMSESVTAVDDGNIEYATCIISLSLYIHIFIYLYIKTSIVSITITWTTHHSWVQCLLRCVSCSCTCVTM